MPFWYVALAIVVMAIGGFGVYLAWTWDYLPPPRVQF